MKEVKKLTNKITNIAETLLEMEKDIPEDDRDDIAGAAEILCHLFNPKRKRWDISDEREKRQRS